MKYTLILTEDDAGMFRVAVRDLPSCSVAAKTRDEALSSIRAEIQRTVAKSEIIEIDVPEELRGHVTKTRTPWHWFGAFGDDPSWEDLFDSVEKNRDETRETR